MTLLLFVLYSYDVIMQLLTACLHQPASTFRAWVLGLCFVAIGGFLNQFFSIRQPGIAVGPNVAQLLAYPAGKFLEKVLPTRQFTTFGYVWSLNP